MSGESVPTTRNGRFDPATKPFEPAKLESLRIRRSLRHTLRQAADIKDITFKTMMDMCEVFSRSPATTRQEICEDANSLAAMVRCWESVVHRIDRIRTPKGKKQADQDGKQQRAEIDNKPPVFELPPGFDDNGNKVFQPPGDATPQ